MNLKYSPMRLVSHFSAVLCLGITASPVAVLADTTCHHSLDEKSIYMRSLQTGLMVSALTCNDSPQYNEFIHRFQPVLARDAKQLQSYYNHQAGGAEELNSFVTHLANDESQRSLQMGSADYCANAAVLFQNVLALQPEQLEDFAATQPIIPDAPVHACPPTATASAAASTATGDITIIPKGSATPKD
jgi:hypothetical protein